MIDLTRLWLIPLFTVVSLSSISIGEGADDSLVEIDSASVPALEPVPTPLMAVSLPISKDPAKWKIGHAAGNRNSILMEIVPEGEEVSSWNELSTNTIFFGASADEYASQWKAGLQLAGASITEEETLPDGSIWVTYSSPSENGSWRYIQGPDGVYGVSYQTRPATEDPQRVQIWRGILREAALQSNPQLPSP